LECGGAPPLFEKGFLDRRSLSFGAHLITLFPMPKPATPWPHAPQHQLSENGTYFVTAGTYLKAHHFRTPQRLEVLQRGLLTVTRDFCWELEAWAVFSNHYHFVAHSQSDSGEASSLSQMVGVLHTKTAGWINRLDKTPGRKVWHNFWDTRLTYQKSYLARLNYVHQNPVKHGLAVVANQYRWCSADSFESVASPAMVRSIYRFKTDALSVSDDFVPIVD
jgi:putative transposase